MARFSGTEGNDFISGTARDDRFEGRAGDDEPLGFEGDDVYVFGPGWGVDTIGGEDALLGGGRDRILFRAGVEAGDLTFEAVRARPYGEVVLSIAAGADRVLVGIGPSADGRGRLVAEELAFADGAVMDISVPRDEWFGPIFGTPGDDGIAGTPRDDAIDGRGGDDNISGYGGDDSIEGGSGNDALSGDGGGDTLRGDDGADFISGGEGDDTLLGGGGRDRLDEFSAGPGEAGSNVFRGGGGNDLLLGNDGDDLLAGGQGNDRYGDRGGSDVVVLRNGWGRDLVADVRAGPGDVDVVRFGAGISAADLTFRLADRGLVVERGGDRLEIASQYRYGGGSDVAIDRLVFADGTRLDLRRPLPEWATQTGTDRGETLEGSVFGDTIRALGGDDIVEGFAGGDRIEAGEGGDAVFGDEGDDAIDGGTGDDFIDGGTGDDAIDGGAGRDAADYGFFYPLGNGGVRVSLAIDGARNTRGAGIDTLSGIEDLFGSFFGDALTGDDGANGLAGGEGDDRLAGGGGGDAIDGGSGDDVALGDVGNDALAGGEGDDALRAGAGDDRLAGGAGDDLMAGGAGRDVARYDDRRDGVAVSLGLRGPQDVGGGELDTLVGVEDLVGTRQADALSGSGRGNALRGEAGDDRLVGRAGDDRLEGGLRNDVLTGGSGADTFAFAPGRGRDRVTDFEDGVDRLEVTGFGPAFDTAAEIVAVAVAFGDGAGTVIALPNPAAPAPSVVRLVGLDLADLDAGDFALVA